MPKKNQPRETLAVPAFHKLALSTLWAGLQSPQYKRLPQLGNRSDFQQCTDFNSMYNTLNKFTLSSLLDNLSMRANHPVTFQKTALGYR